jgi:hypothetical protein
MLSIRRFTPSRRALALWWLTMPGRWPDGDTPPVWRWTLVAIPVVMALLDGCVENVSIAKMLRQWPDLSPGLVEVASLATRLKLVMGVLTEVAMAVLAAAAALRWFRLRRA